MYFTKLIPLALAAIAPVVVAAPFQLEERQSSNCQQALAELGQAAAYYKSATNAWTGAAASAIESELNSFNQATENISKICAQIDQAISNAGQSYEQAESQNSDLWG